MTSEQHQVDSDGHLVILSQPLHVNQVSVFLVNNNKKKKKKKLVIPISDICDTYLHISVTSYFQTSSNDILHSVSLPHFSCPPCLEYLCPCALILLRLWLYINHVLTYLLNNNLRLLQLQTNRYDYKYNQQNEQQAVMQDSTGTIEHKAGKQPNITQGLARV